MKFRQIIFLIIVLITYGCTMDSTSTKDDNSRNDTNYNKRFDRIVKDFYWKRVKTYHNAVDKFLVEKEFNEIIKDSLKNIVGRAGTIWNNTFDTLRNRREIIFIDSSMNYFYLLSTENNNINHIGFGDSIKFNGRLLGFFFNEDKQNPELAQPTFVASIDTLFIIKNHERRK